MKITQFVINRKTFISMLFIALVLLGVISYKQLPAELFPNAELPFLIVNVSSQQEYDPSYVEREAIIPIEGAISSLEGIDEIVSEVDRRRAVVYVYFNQNVNTKYAFLRLEEKINLIREDLGDEFFVTVFKIDTEQLSNVFMTLQVRGSGGVDRVREVTDQEVLNELESLDGIASVQVLGGQQKSIQIIMDEHACKANNVTPARIRNLIAQNSRYKTFVGKAYEQDRYYFVNLVADYTDVRQLENIVVNQDGPVLLRDVADIIFGVKEQESISRVNGKDAVTVSLSRDSQSNLIELAHDTRAVIESLNDKLAFLDIEIVIQSDSAEPIEENIDQIIQLALFGGLLAVVVLWIFLRNLKWVLIITLAIPISIYTSFNFFYLADISINSLTLVGMALAVGMLLDNSVVVIENIYRLLSRGRDHNTAVIQGTQEVWRAVTAATLTTVAFFVPFVFVDNYLIRLLGKNISVSITSTLVVSLVVALFLIPMLTHWLVTRMRRSGTIPIFQTVSPKNRLIQIYNVLLKSCLRHPASTIIIVVLLFFFSLFFAVALSINVPEEVETREFSLYVTMDQGATLERTDLLVAEIESQVEDLAEKEEVISQIYEDEAVVTFKLFENYEKIDGRSLQAIKDDVDKRIEGVSGGEIEFEQPMSAGSRFGGRQSGGADLQRLLGIGLATEKVVIKGRDFDRMRNFAEEISEYLEDLDSVQSSNVSASSERPEVHLYFDQMIMNAYGVTLADIATELSTFQSSFNSQLSFKQGTDEYDITIRGDSLEDKTWDDLQNLDISATSGDIYQLSDLARIVYAQGLGSINRVNQEKQVEVNYRFLSEITSSKQLLEIARLEVDDLVANINVPNGIAVEVLHEEMDLSEFKFLLIADLLLIFMILAAVFESLFAPFVIMFTIPLAAIGSLWALILTGNSILTANTIVGFLFLIGVVVNSGIIYIDYTRILRQRGFSRSRALMMAGHARVRPILITVITTIIAMLPLAMGKAEYVAKIGAPFAITLIGGLASSTLMTLIFIPTLYFGLENAIRWFRGLNWRLQLLQFVVWVVLDVLVYLKVDNLIMQIFYWFFITLLVPGVTYFLLVSLRRANARIVGADEPLTIRIRRLVKVYDESSRFVREWKKGLVIRERAGLQKEYKSWRDFEDWLWQAPLLLFLFYFTYIYLDSYFWSFVLSHAVYFTILHLWRPLYNFLVTTKPGLSTLLYHADRFLRWGLPFLALTIFYIKWQSIGSVIFIGSLWYLALAIYTTSYRLHKENVNIARVTGRFSGTRRWFYRFVQIIPVIGRRRKPFRALDRISLEIGSGMFGLLGPNGAGKTTLMRIICGIFEQSRGKIWINDKNLSQFREEFQGLIGYLPQEFGMYENMSAFAFLDYQALLKGLVEPKARQERIQYVLRAVHMDERQHDKIGSYSGGMKQRIGIALTLLHLPRILVVDEPTAGLDPRERIRFRNLLVELSRERIVIFSTHIIEDISSSCNRVAVLDRGMLKYLGDPNDMARLAEGRVWQFHVSPGDFDAVQSDHLVVHHIRVQDEIRVRCITEKAPIPEAISVKPSLEDSYLWLLKKK
ncbi:ATP-binding cassette domain-containing protein [candidate division KSB1 bacterium]|nr:efflux RND transporter permease subunit [candidate division KSB1 bacterium]RQW04720.1 MAG: ATP-binding cassette domain-containing protein [candidate division KSB1 bacterium]